MKKIFLILCLFATSINAMDEDLEQLYSLQTIQRWETQLNRISALVSEDLKAKDAQTPEMDTPGEQIDAIITQLRQDIARWRKHENTSAAQSILQSLSLQDTQAISSTFARTMQTFTMVELKYTALLGKSVIKERQKLNKQVRDDAALRASILPAVCIGGGCGLIAAGLYAYATRQNQ